MKRRDILSLLGAAASFRPLAARAQQPAGNVRRIGFLTSASTVSDAAFLQWNWVLALRELGWIEGTTIAFERRASDGRYDLLPALARELVAANVEIIATFSAPDTVAAKQATSTIPIVMIYSGLDPVADGLVASFARPGGNITGVSRMLVETEGKRLELIREVLPTASRVGMLVVRRTEASRQAELQRRLLAAARELRIELEFVAYGDQGELEAALPALASRGVQGFMLEPSFQAFANRRRIAALALAHRLPGVFTLREYAEAGGLLSYGPDYPALERQHARYVDRILRGANPAELPIEQPTTFELVINLKTATALGLTIPPLVLQRADEVIE